MNSHDGNPVPWDQFSKSWSLHGMEAPTGRFNGDREENSPSPPFQPPSYAIRVAPDKSLQWDPPADSEELAIALSYHFPLPQTLEAKMQAATQKWLHDRRSRYATTTSLERTQTKARRNAGQNVYGQIQVLADPERPLPRLRHPKGNVSSIRSYNSRDEVTNCVASPPHPPNGNARNSRPEGSNQQPSGPSRHPDKPCLISWKVETGDNSHRVPKKRRYLEDERLRVAKNRGNACEDHRRRRQKCDPMDCPQNKQRLNKDTASQVTSSSHHNLHIKSNSSFLPSQGPECIERGDSNVAHMTETPSRGTLSPSTLSRTTREPQCKAGAQNIPETQPTAGAKYAFVKHSATISQTSISSSPPPKIFTPTNASSSGQSFSDLSITSLQVQESYNLFNVADCTGRGNPQAEINAVQLSPANGMHHVYHASTTTDYLMGGDSLNTHITNPDVNSQMHSDVDFESFIHSEGFLPLDQNSSNVYNLGIADDSCNPPTSINPRRLSKTPLTEPLTSSQNWTATSGSSPSKEAFGKQKACDEGQMAAMLITHLSSPATSARHGGSSYPGLEGNNPPVRACPAPIKTSATRSLSGKSTHSSNTRCSSSSGESPRTVIRRGSAASTASQDWRYYAVLHRGPSAPSRDDHLEGIGRRDSTNSSTSQESQREGEEWRGARSNRLRNSDSPDAAQRPSSSDRDSFPGGSEGCSDDACTPPARIRRRRAFSFGYKGRPWATHRGAFSRSGHGDRDQTVEELSSGLSLVHI